MADRYWVGGTAAWDGTAGTKWSTTSGGGGGASVPTSADDVFFTNLSTGTCTISSGNTGAKSINCTGFTGTLAGSTNITVSGSVTLVAGMGFTYANTFVINGTGTITTAGKTIGGLNIDGTGITVTLGDAVTISATLGVVRGTFNTANYNVTALTLSSSGSNVRTISLGSSTVTLSTGANAVDFTTNTNLTFNAGTSTIVCTATGCSLAGGNLSQNGVAFYNVSFTSTATGTYSILGINTFNNLTVTAPSSVGVRQVAFESRQTINGTLSTTGTAGNRRVWFRGVTYGIAQTLTINSAPSLTDADFRDIYVIGTAAPISGTRVGDLRGCRGITFDTPKTVYWNLAAGGNWSANAWAASSGAGVSTDNFPLAQDTAVIENTGLNNFATVQIDSALATHISSVNMSTRTNAMTITMNVGTTCYGNWTNGSGTSVTGFVTLTFSGRNTQTITSAGKTFAGGITVDTYGGTVELADALNIGSNTLTITNGTFDTKNYNVTANAISSSNSNVRTIALGSSTLTLSGSSFITFTTSTNLTLNAGTSQINSPNTAGPTLDGGSGFTFYNVSFTGTSPVSHTVFGANSFNNLTVTAPSSAGLIQLELAANQTITGTLTVAGATAVRRIFVRSNTIGTTRRLTVGTLSATDCDFRDITIAGTAAGSSPTRAGDCGGNSGIAFPAAKTVYWNLAGAQNWSATAWAPGSGGSPDINNFPLAQDTAVFDEAAGSVTGTITINAAWNIGTFDASLRTSAMTLTTSTNTPFVYGDWKFGTGVTSSSAGGTITFAKRGTQTITSNGITFGCPVTVNSVTGVVQLADALSLGSTRTLTLASGTFDAVSYSVTTGFFTSTAGTLKMGSGAWSLSGTGNVWTYTAGTLYKGTADILLSSATNLARTFAGGNQSYNKLTITPNGNGLTVTGNNQFTEFAAPVTLNFSINFGTTTQTFGKWSISGGNFGLILVAISGNATHILAGPCTSGIDYLQMNTFGFAATSPGEFYAGANSTGTAAAPVYRTAKPADSTRYWVGGTGNWSDTARWSTSSGGGSGASVPRSHDDVVFDSLSNATAYTATVNAVTGGIRMKSLTIAGPASGNVTLAGSTAIDGIHGNVTLPATGLTRTYTGAITLSGSTSGKTLTTNGVALASTITVNGVGCEWTLGSALNIGNADLRVTNGSFDTASYNVTAGGFVSDHGNSITYSLGSSIISFSGSGNTLNFGTTETSAANLTFTSGTSQLNFTNANPGITGNGKTFYNVSFTSVGAGTVTINGANTFNNLSFTGITSAGLKIISVTANQTITGTLTCSAGTDATMRHFVRSNAFSITRTLTCAAVSLTDVDFRAITIAGVAAPATGTRIGDCKGNSGITFDAAKTVYTVSAASQNWSSVNLWSNTTTPGTGSADYFPLAQDTAVFMAAVPNSGATITVNAAYNIGTIDMSARTTNTMTLATGSTTPAIYGNWVNGTGTTLTGTGAMTFAGRGSQTVTSAGRAFTQVFSISTPDGSVTLQDALTINNASSGIALDFGTINANGYNVTLQATMQASSGSGIRTVAIGSGTWTTAESSAAAWNTGGTNVSITGTGTISLTGSSFKTFTGGGKDYSGITLNQGGAGQLTITGNNTFANITNTYKATGATTINFGTTTQRVGSFTAAGEAGRVLTLIGSSASSPATLVLTSGTVTAPDYLTITGIRAYDLNATWYAGANSTNNGSLGWLFEAAGGTTFNVSFSDTATGADAFSVTAAFNASFSDTVTGADAFSAGLSFAAAFSDTATGSDAVSASFAFNVSFSDTATGADTVSAGPAFNVSFSDTATGADTVAVAASTFGAAISDTATGADAVSSTGTFSVSVSDTATSADTVAVAASTFGAAFSDTAVGADAFVAGIAFSAAFSDTATGADSLLAGLSFSAAFSDTATGADAVSTIATLGVEFSDAATGADAVSAAATLNVFFSDTASGLDAPAVAASTFNASFSASAIGQDTPAVAGSTFSVSLSETGAITDVVVGGYLWNPIDDTQSANWQNVITAQSPGWVQINDAQGPNWVEIQT